MTARARNNIHVHVPLPSDDEEEDWDQAGGRRHHAQPRPDKVRLAPIWVKKVEDWFVLAESTFNRNGVTDSRLKFDLVLPALSDEILDQLGGVLRSASVVRDPYLSLKNRLLEMFQPAKLDLMNQLIWGPELGGRKPSLMMESMLALLPEGEQDGLLFKAHFIARLPADFKDQVAVHFEDMDSRSLAKIADQFWHIRNSKGAKATSVAVAAIRDDQESQDEDGVVAAVKPQRPKFKPKKTFPPRSGQQKGQKPVVAQPASQVTVCGRHKKFGPDAWKCDDPSSCFMAAFTTQGN